LLKNNSDFEVKMTIKESISEKYNVDWRCVGTGRTVYPYCDDFDWVNIKLTNKVYSFSTRINDKVIKYHTTGYIEFISQHKIIDISGLDETKIFELIDEYLEKKSNNCFFFT